MRPSALHGSPGDRRRFALSTFVALSTVLAANLGPVAAADRALPAATVAVLKRYCIECHGNESAEARIDLEQLTAAPDVGRGFKDWEKAIRMLQQRKMPPKDASQPTDAERRDAATAIQQALDTFIEQHAHDPGPIVLRRLTAAEYNYAIQDL